jgi:hypothetical protein
MNRIEPNLKTSLAEVDSIELFPASEGFFAYQDSQRERNVTTLEFRDFLRIKIL